MPTGVRGAPSKIDRMKRKMCVDFERSQFVSKLLTDGVTCDERWGATLPGKSTKDSNGHSTDPNFPTLTVPPFFHLGILFVTVVLIRSKRQQQILTPYAAFFFSSSSLVSSIYFLAPCAQSDDQHCVRCRVEPETDSRSLIHIYTRIFISLFENKEKGTTY